MVLCLQDTTELDFNGQLIEGLGPLSYEAQRGMYTPNGKVFGFQFCKNIVKGLKTTTLDAHDYAQIDRTRGLKSNGTETYAKNFYDKKLTLKLSTKSIKRQIVYKCGEKRFNRHVFYI